MNHKNTLLLLLALLLVLTLITVYSLKREEPTVDFQNLEASPHSISRDTVRRLFDEAPSIWEREEGYEDLVVICQFFEGIRCYYVPHTLANSYDFGYNRDIETEANRVDEEFSVHIVMAELTPQFVERSRNSTVLLHCQRKQDAITACAINNGSGQWKSVRLRVLRRFP